MTSSQIWFMYKEGCKDFIKIIIPGELLPNIPKGKNIFSFHPKHILKLASKIINHSIT